MSNSQLIRGGCHCHALSYELQWPAPVSRDEKLTLPGRRCSCSFCTRIDGVWTSHPQAHLIITENPDHPAIRYRFGTGTADFLFCSVCGIMPLVTCENEGQVFAVVNIHTIDEEDLERIALEVSETCFDAESTGDRLARRKQRWISSVSWIGR